MWWRNAKPGDKVICVREPYHVKPHLKDRAQKLKLGRVYSIATVEPDDKLVNGVAIIMRGIPLGVSPILFRPLRKKSTERGMRMLYTILNSGKVG